jgi:alpha-glutamyl/putrescinyl thymine pyrophosphorylase clade 1
VTKSSENSALSALKRLAYWINERESIRTLKELGAAKLTNDGILASYRFCNVRREDDKVTRWIAKFWRNPNAEDGWLPHAMIVARFINWPETLEAIGYPEPWPVRKNQIREQLHAIKGKVFTGAYIVSTNGVKMNKIDYVCQTFDRTARATLQPKYSQSLKSYHAQLMTFNGLGSFMAAQVIADLKYAPVLRHSPDWNSWAAPGPGSLRGLNRVRGFDLKRHWRADEFSNELLLLRIQLGLEVKNAGYLLRDLQNLQNCLCEFDKYERVRNGEGKPRATYHYER